jgi:hypothetical protein
MLCSIPQQEWPALATMKGALRFKRGRPQSRESIKSRDSIDSIDSTMSHDTDELTEELNSEIEHIRDELRLVGIPMCPLCLPPAHVAAHVQVHQMRLMYNAGKIDSKKKVARPLFARLVTPRFLLQGSRFTIHITDLCVYTTDLCVYTTDLCVTPLPLRLHH